VDRYTKTMLTIIAAALCSLVAQNAIGQLQAQSGKPQPVVICDASGFGCANVSTFSNSLYTTNIAP
jgi:hypothetical protein